MILCVNGKFLPEEQAVVSVLDRGFLYGDGLFETIRVANGMPFRWKQHMERLRGGVGFLRMRLPWEAEEIRQMAHKLVEENGLWEGVLRIGLSRGVGRRGYSPQGAGQPTLVMSLHPLIAKPQSWRLVTTNYRVWPGDPLSQFKTSNKLPQVLARAEAEERGAEEGLLLTPSGMIAEATSGNIFWTREGVVETPPREVGILPGITRAVILELCGRLGVATREALLAPDAVAEVQGMFVSLSSWGLVNVSHLEGQRIAVSDETERLQGAYQELLDAETGQR